MEGMIRIERDALLALKEFEKEKKGDQDAIPDGPV
jgi:hypothetical protein